MYTGNDNRIAKAKQGANCIFTTATTAIAVLSTAVFSPVHHNHHKRHFKFKHHHECKTIRCKQNADKLWNKLHHPKSISSDHSGWVIPVAIVMCESGGANLPPNSATASGYYQIIDSTWEENGGSPPNEAYRHSKAEQDAVAARIWATAGQSAWVCQA